MNIFHRKLKFDRNKRKKWQQRFRHEWLIKYNWIEKKEERPYCKVCFKSLSNNVHHLDRHRVTKFHLRRVMLMKNQPQIQNDSVRSEFEKRQNKIKTAELKIIMFLLEHNLPFTLIEPVIKLIQAVATDSELVKHIKCGTTKATETTNALLLNESLLHITKFLKNQPFSLIIDETTDVSTKKCLALVARYFDYTAGKVKDRFLSLLEIEKFDALSTYVQCH